MSKTNAKYVLSGTSEVVTINKMMGFSITLPTSSTPVCLPRLVLHTFKPKRVKSQTGRPHCSSTPSTEERCRIGGLHARILKVFPVGKIDTTIDLVQTNVVINTKAHGSSAKKIMR